MESTNWTIIRETTCCSSLKICNHYWNDHKKAIPSDLWVFMWKWIKTTKWVFYCHLFSPIGFCPTAIKCLISNAQIKCLKCTKKKIFWIEYVNFHKIRAKSTKSFTRFTYNMATLSNALVQLFKLSVFYSVHLVKHIVMTVIM